MTKVSIRHEPPRVIDGSGRSTLGTYVVTIDGSDTGFSYTADVDAYGLPDRASAFASAKRHAASAFALSED